MKKLKIFLLLSILLCFGFALSSEVHAQGGGPKIFEVNDVLPATTQLRIYFNGGVNALESASNLASDNNNFYFIVEERPEIFAFRDGEIYFEIFDYDEEIWITPFNGTTHNYMDIDTSSWSLSKRTISSVGDCSFTWEDLAPAPSGFSITFEENGGTSVTDLSGQIVLPNPLPIPSKENYTFLGWYYDSSLTNRAFPGDTLTDDIVLYAKWGSGKPFEISDVLPAGYIKISWDFTDKPLPDLGDSNSFMIMGIGNDSGIDIEITQYELPSYGYYREMYIEYGTGYDDNIEERFILDTPSYTIISLPEPIVIESIDDDGEDYYEFIHGALLWEVVSPEYLIDYDDLYDGEILDIEEGTLLPASIIGINLVFYNTGGSKSGTVTFTFSEPGYEYGQIILTAQEDNLGRRVATAKIIYQQNPSPRGWDIYTIDDTLADQSFGSTRGTLFAGILLDFSWLLPEARTITDITIEGDLEMDVIFTRILTDEELAYQEGYSNGYTTAREIYGWKYGDDWYNGIDAWYLGEKYAREIYGYYDSRTNEWLSVEEYLELYGTDKPGQSDFYGNFDKYFIPAMIIVFGGAILITALKVFKGREQ